MKFGYSQKQRFLSTDGAYSILTDREQEDSQVTLTDHEALLVISHFGEADIIRGGVKSDPKKAAKEFSLYPTGKTISFNLNFPKSTSNELRLYLNRHFKPESGTVIFMFEKNGRMWIGSMTETEWRTGSAEIIKDEFDSSYQESLFETGENRIITLKARDVYKRDRKIALSRMETAGYVCESASSHGLFLSRRSGNPFLEAHHLIPMEFQNVFPASLDTMENVFCLCPNCHRAVHHAQKDTARGILENLLARRNILANYAMSSSDLHALYGVEDIV